MWSEKGEQQVEGKQSHGLNVFNTIQTFDKQMVTNYCFEENNEV